MPSTLDQMIAQSKEITEDLMAVRRGIKSSVSARSEDIARRRAEDRLYLVLNSLHLLIDQVRTAWQQAAGLHDETRRKQQTVRAERVDGQLKLIAGDR